MATPQSSAESTALITGASAGIGYELTKIFAREGYHIFPCLPALLRRRSAPICAGLARDPAWGSN